VVDLVVGVPYTTSIEAIQSALADAARERLGGDRQIEQHSVIAVLRHIGVAPSLEIMVRFYVLTPEVEPVPAHPGKRAVRCAGAVPAARAADHQLDQHAVRGRLGAALARPRLHARRRRAAPPASLRRGADDSA
jgi:hypothetical protein